MPGSQVGSLTRRATLRATIFSRTARDSKVGPSNGRRNEMSYGCGLMMWPQS
jgi:hypothetical protein